MTAPIIFQQPGVGQQVQKGLAPLLEALQFAQKKKQADQQLALRQQALQQQQQQLELQGMSQRSLERERIVNRALEFVNLFGPDILEDESVAGMLEEGGIKPQAVLKRHKEQEKAAQEAQEGAIDVALSGLTPDVAKVMRRAIALEPVLGKEATTVFMRQGFEQLKERKPEEIDKLRSQYPQLFADLPEPDAILAAVSINVEQAQIKAQVGPGYERQLRNRLAQERIEIARLDRITKGRPGTRQFQAATTIAGIVQRALNDQTALAIMGLIGKPQHEQIEALFGKTTADIYFTLPDLLSKELQPDK